MGIVVYEMLTGRVPFESDTPQGYALKHALEQPPPFRTIKPDIPLMDEVEMVVMKALSKDREQRYRTVRDFVHAFAEAVATTTKLEQGATAIELERGRSASEFISSHATSVLERTLAGDPYAVTCVAFSPDGQTLASCGYDNTVKLWDVASWTLRQTLAAHVDRGFSVAFSPGGKLLASGGRDQTLKFWDAASRALLQTLTGHHADAIAAIAYRPDGELLASGVIAYGTIKL